MAAGILHDVTLSYQLLWNAQRQVAGVKLLLEPNESSGCDADHLLSALYQVWDGACAPLILSTSCISLLTDLLDKARPGLVRIELLDTDLQNPQVAQGMARAQQRGVALVWRNEPGVHLKASHTRYFTQSIVRLSTEEALTCFRLARGRPNSGFPALGTPSPVHTGQIIEGVASEALANHCLDEQGASALLGWPVDDVLYEHRPGRIQPGQPVILELIKAILADTSMDDIEQRMGQEPILVYRFLRYLNSAGLGLNRDITALRHGLMVLGLGRLTAWLEEQLPQASIDLNLQPVATCMVLRATLMTALLDAGAGDALEREITLCGLLSQIDALLDEPLVVALHAIPLPERVTSALLDHSGPYWPYLDMVNALETCHSDAIRATCENHGFDAENVNLVLLRTLSAMRLN